MASRFILGRDDHGTVKGASLKGVWSYLLLRSLHLLRVFLLHLNDDAKSDSHDLVLKETI